MKSNEIIYEIRAGQNDLLENLEKIKQTSDVELLTALEEIKRREIKILETIENIISDESI